MVKRSIEEGLTMTIAFQIKTKATPFSKPAPVTLRQLAAFRAFAQSHEHLVGVFDDHDFACGVLRPRMPVKLGELSTKFRQPDAMISIIEETLFLGLNVRCWRSTADAEITMSVSLSPDGAFPINLRDTNA